ncbi:aromatic ring-hydroxylating dioxygenase subunit alpha [Aquabacterium sp.]|uniref:aromatic ring-hydroxylating dioxygenase subunit alpha n=1 Tax=Aquabacterium sp. TaxID=1872578 RepID=UPI002C20A43E|nr:aromatic ring-hydroxylating dioxygenase subunit alpha [Aquabacterium sp.]HSW07940.1 aromatic ring-hydroxylating dioxygenase subunit alpha [Aquabacterium sp.]
MFVKNCWYVAAWDHEVLADTLLARTIVGESVLVYRKADGTPVAIDNRCAHRHAPLSLGRKEGDAVRCLYHGLKYGSDGRCTEIPGQETIPDKLCVRSYPALERGRWIWVWMGDPARADEALIPDAFSLKHAEWRYKPGYLHYDADHLLICDNLLDFSHLSYVHEKTLGGSPNIAEARPSVQRLARGVHVTREVRNTVPAPYHARLGGFSGQVNRRFAYDFLVPGVLLMHAHVKPADSADDDMSGALQFHSCQALTPETATTTHYFFMQAHRFRLDDATITESIYQSLCTAFEEDRRIIEAQQRLIAASPPRPMQPIAADLALSQYRRVVEQLMEAERVSIVQPPAPRTPGTVASTAATR